MPGTHEPWQPLKQLLLVLSNIKTSGRFCWSGSTYSQLSWVSAAPAERKSEASNLASETSNRRPRGTPNKSATAFSTHRLRWGLISLVCWYSEKREIIYSRKSKTKHDLSFACTHLLLVFQSWHRQRLKESSCWRKLCRYHFKRQEYELICLVAKQCVIMFCILTLEESIFKMYRIEILLASA